MLSQDGFVKLIDFELSLKIGTRKVLSNAKCGTAQYIAPEIIEGRPYDYAVDWWSFGVVLYEMVVGVPLLSGSSKEEVFQQTLDGDIKVPSYLSSDMQQLLWQFLERDPSKRLIMEAEIKGQKWFKDVMWDELSKQEPPIQLKLSDPYDLRYFVKNYEVEEECSGIEISGEMHWKGISELQ